MAIVAHRYSSRSEAKSKAAILIRGIEELYPLSEEMISVKKLDGRTEYKLGPVTVIVCYDDIVLDSEGTRLSQETGWWDYRGIIYIWGPELSRMQKLGIGIHEFVEMVLESKLRMPHSWSHFVSNVLEFVFTLGRSKPDW